MIYTGDIKIQQLDDGTYDIVFENGQPQMTNGFETIALMAIFGQDWWGNDITNNESEKMQSTFPDVIKRNVVTDKTKNDGTQAIIKSTSFMVKEKIVKKISVTGEIFSAFGISWQIEFEALTNKTLKYFINWEKGELTAGLIGS